MSEDRPISKAFSLIADLGTALGVKSIKDLPGLWEHQVDEFWRFAVNGRSEEIRGVPPYHCMVEFNGWPAGLFTPHGEGFIAHGEVANEDTFIDALEAAIRKAKKAQHTDSPDQKP